MNYYNEKIKINEEYLRGLTATELCEINLSGTEIILIELKDVLMDALFGVHARLQVTAYDIEGNGKLISLSVDDDMTHDDFRTRLIEELRTLEKMLA